jgi:Rrf2 family protein
VQQHTTLREWLNRRPALPCDQLSQLVHGDKYAVPMRLTSRTDYALRAAMELAAAGGHPLTTSELGKGQGIPATYLGAVLAELRRGGIVKARRGVDGGWTLAKSAREISLADVIRAVDGTLANVAGTRPEKLSYKGAAKGLRTALIAVRAAEREILEGLSLADAVAERFPARVKRLIDDPKAWR